MMIKTLTKARECTGVMVGYMSLSYSVKAGKANELLINVHPPKYDRSQQREITMSDEEVLNLIAYAKQVGIVKGGA